MSDGAVYRELLAFVLKLEPPAVAERDLMAALDAARSGPLAFLYAAAIDAGCDAPTARARAAGCYACFAAGNLADDLADGDCDYLEQPVATGPAVEFVLLHAAYALWLGPGGVGPSAAASAARALARGATEQLVEVRKPRFTFEIVRNIVQGMGGQQYASHLQVLWDGSAVAGNARSVGSALGNAGFVAEDRRSSDPRYTSLAPDERRALTAWAREELERASAIELPSIAATARYIRPLLEGEP